MVISETLHSRDSEGNRGIVHAVECVGRADICEA
jgi:hypothetical protein